MFERLFQLKELNLALRLLQSTGYSKSQFCRVSLNSYGSRGKARVVILIMLIRLAPLKVSTNAGFAIGSPSAPQNVFASANKGSLGHRFVHI